jgi:hypothetical protein
MIEKMPIEEASHQLCSALHLEGINPGDVEIRLPREAWWRMYILLEQRHRGMMTFDGRGREPGKFQYMGITYVPKDG